jgi:hypothetical protein
VIQEDFLVQCGYASPASTGRDCHRTVTLLALRIQLGPVAKDFDLMQDIIDYAVMDTDDLSYRASYLISYLFYLI